jgi:hypothetical protein
MRAVIVVGVPGEDIADHVLKADGAAEGTADRR